MEKKLKEFAKEYFNKDVKWTYEPRGFYGDSGNAIVAPHPTNENFELYVEYHTDPYQENLGDFDAFVNHFGEDVHDKYPQLENYQLFIYTLNTHFDKVEERITINITGDTSHFYEQLSDAGWDDELEIGGRSIEDIWF